VLFDDVTRGWVSFNDADLVGLPLRITLTKSAGKWRIELKRRDRTEVVIIHSLLWRVFAEIARSGKHKANIKSIVLL
jgi:hypothetical protein